MQEAIGERVAEEVVDRVGGEGVFDQLESAAESLEEEMQERDLDGDGEVSEAEQQEALNEPGATMNNPLLMQFDETYSDEVSLARQRFYQLQVPSGGFATLEVRNTGEVGNLVFAATMLEGGFSADGEIPAGQSESYPIMLGDNQGGTLNIFFFNFSETTFEMTATGGMQNDADLAGDAGNREEPSAIDVGSGYIGMIGGGDSEDAYRLRSDAFELVQLIVTADETNAEPISVYFQSSGGNSDRADNILPGSSATLYLASDEEAFNDFYVTSDKGAAYSFDIAIVADVDADMGVDAGERNQPLAVQPGSNYQGVSVIGNNDCYSFMGVADGSIVIDFATDFDHPFDTHTKVELYKGSDYISSATSDPNGNGKFEFGVVDYEATESAEYTACFYGYNYYPFTNYEFTVNING